VYLINYFVFTLTGGCDAPIVLVGNKSDLARQVSLERVLQTKQEVMNNCPYIETSAKFNLNVIKLFIELLQVRNTFLVVMSYVCVTDIMLSCIECCITRNMTGNKLQDKQTRDVVF
jgi:predicted GTPase